MTLTNLSKILLPLFLVATLSACKSDASLHTQASAQTEVQADEYVVFVNFKQQGKDQKSLMTTLQNQTTVFVTWAHKQFSEDTLASDQMNMRPVYEYPKNQARKLVSYEASLGFKLSGLNFKQYNDALQSLPDFNAESFGLQSVQASAQQLQISRDAMVATAFTKNELKAQNLAQLSGLCELKVLEIQEHDQQGGQPRMMMLESKGASNAPSKKSLSVRLNIIWSAQPC